MCNTFNPKLTRAPIHLIRNTNMHDHYTATILPRRQVIIKTHANIKKQILKINSKLILSPSLRPTSTLNLLRQLIQPLPNRLIRMLGILKMNPMRPFQRHRLQIRQKLGTSQRYCSNRPIGHWVVIRDDGEGGLGDGDIPLVMCEFPGEVFIAYCIEL